MQIQQTSPILIADEERQTSIGLAASRPHLPLQAENDQMRLSLDGGFPWETVRTERKIFEVLHADATGSQHFFRTLSMIPALLLPPRWFYAGRQWLGARSWYRNVRTGPLPIPRVNAAASSKEFKV